jgi:hypothetical protein
MIRLPNYFLFYNLSKYLAVTISIYLLSMKPTQMQAFLFNRRFQTCTFLGNYHYHLFFFVLN